MGDQTDPISRLLQSLLGNPLRDLGGNVGMILSSPELYHAQCTILRYRVNIHNSSSELFSCSHYHRLMREAN